MTSFKPLSILVVDDNLDHADLIIDGLYEFSTNNSCHHVQNGEQAIAYLQHREPYVDQEQYPMPNLILLDIRMPRMDGILTLKTIKNDEQLACIPIIMLSTSGIKSEIQDCYRLGASGYIQKPLQYEEFSRKIKELNHYWTTTSELSFE